jgi:4,5:9,10-diseco-3-hydroxy-5,9,17-trioxoandrosta-1(10),2-diene-4-oate hydrolase
VTPLDFEGTSRYLEGEYRLHYHEAGFGPPLVLLHGSGPGVSGWSNFAGNFPVFAQRFRTVVFDLPGFGRSERPALDRAYPRVVAEALIVLLDKLSLAHAHVLGNAMGGYVALEFALAAPERVDRLVLMGPGGLSINVLGPDPSEGARRLADFMMAPSRQAMVDWVDTMVSDKSVVDDALIDERLANAEAPGAMESAMAIFSSLAEHPEPMPMWARLKGIEAPTLVVWGRDDRMLPLESALLGFRQLPNAELHVFSRCGHWPQVERKTDFERLVIDFLSRD